MSGRAVILLQGARKGLAKNCHPPAEWLEGAVCLGYPARTTQEVDVNFAMVATGAVHTIALRPATTSKKQEEEEEDKARRPTSTAQLPTNNTASAALNVGGRP